MLNEKESAILFSLNIYKKRNAEIRASALRGADMKWITRDQFLTVVRLVAPVVSHGHWQCS